MALKINGKWFLTVREAGQIINAKTALMSYWIYNGHFSGCIEYDDTEELIAEGESAGITAEMAGRIRRPVGSRLKNHFMIPLASVLEKIEKLEEKKVRVRDKKIMAMNPARKPTTVERAAKKLEKAMIALKLAEEKEMLSRTEVVVNMEVANG